MRNKNREIFEKFEKEMFYFLQRNGEHFQTFCHIVEQEAGKITQDELVYRYIQLFKNNHFYLNDKVFIFENDKYNGKKTVKRIPGFWFQPGQTVKVEGKDYSYKMTEQTFPAIYYDMMKACGYSRKSAAKLRAEIHKNLQQQQDILRHEAQAAIRIIEYSEKSIAVVGDTKPIKEQLKSMNGKFNKFLKDENGERFAGWVFSKKRTDQVKQTLNL